MGPVGYINVPIERLFKDEFLERARLRHPNGLLICGRCGWSWLTTETAVYHWDDDVICADLSDCIRRSGMRMKTFVPSKRSTKGKLYDFSTGRRSTPICTHDAITATGVVRGEKCYCHIPEKVN